MHLALGCSESSKLPWQRRRIRALSKDEAGMTGLSVAASIATGMLRGNELVAKVNRTTRVRFVEFRNALQGGEAHLLRIPTHGYHDFLPSP
jgi:hypothetical protein